MRAYPGGSAQKAATIAAIDAAIREGRLLGEEPDTGRSLIACIAGRNDPRAYELATGVPGSLGLLADAAIAGMSDLSTARRFATAWVDGPAVGADLGSVPGETILWLLDQAVASGFAAGEVRVAATLAAVRHLHRRQLEGEVIDRAGWAAVRAEAIATTDSCGQDGTALLGKLAETVAWPALSARTIIVEGIRILAELEAIAAQARSDMPAAERTDIRRTMDALYAETETERDADPDNYWFPDLFEARFPYLHARFMTDLKLGNDAYLGTFADGADRALSLIHAASVA